MDGLIVSFTTLAITVFISLLVALIVKMMTMLLSKWAQQSASDHADEKQGVSDDSEIAAVIAIAQAQRKQ